LVRSRPKPGFDVDVVHAAVEGVVLGGEVAAVVVAEDADAVEDIGVVVEPIAEGLHLARIASTNRRRPSGNALGTAAEEWELIFDRRAEAQLTPAMTSIVNGAAKQKMAAGS
jgi:hypothetical protein